MENILTAFLSKTLNMDNEQVADLVKTEGDVSEDQVIAKLLDLDKQRVQRLSNASDETLKERFENGYSKAKSEVLTSFEKELREKFELQSDKKGLDLINDLIEKRVSSFKKDGLVPDEVKKSAVYLDMLKFKDEEKQKELEAIKTDYEQKLNEYKRSEENKIISEKALTIIDSLNPVFSEDKTRAANQRKSIVEKLLTSIPFMIQDGNIIPLTSDGKLLEDEHKNPVPFEKLVRETTIQLFDLKVADSRSSAGGKDDKGSADSQVNFKWNGTPPSNEDQFMKFISNASSLEEKNAIIESWNKVKQGN